MSTIGSTTDTVTEATEAETRSPTVDARQEITVQSASTQNEEANDKFDNVDGIMPDSPANVDAPLKPKIGYRVEYRNRWTDQLIAEEVQEEDKRPVIHQSDGPIFEVVTSFKIFAETMKTENNFDINSQSFGSYAIRIHSIALINAIQSVVRYYPGQDLSGTYITIPKPYPILVHHYKQLQDFRNRCLSMPQDELCIRERDAAEHLSILLEYLDNEVMKDVREEQERNKRGLSMFEWRWVALRPGVTVLERADHDSLWEASVVHSVRGGVLENPLTSWEVDTWSMKYDGRFISRVMNRTTMWPKFDGERHDIRDSGEETIFIDPVEDEDCLDTELAQELIANGKEYMGMLKPKCFQHHGRSISFPQIEVS